METNYTINENGIIALNDVIIPMDEASELYQNYIVFLQSNGIVEIINTQPENIQNAIEISNGVFDLK
jgi:hypothetical protein